ncbi:MAG: NAD-dependent malic enzyme [Thermodesulfobacteriota bacterium]|nr:NAD-dependent malic enzyme [Thermodesulfobacteriota bacterium]
MSAKDYEFVFGQFGNTKEIKVKARGAELLNNHYLNKGTNFSKTEREKFNIDGTLPPHAISLTEQVDVCIKIADQKSDDIEKYIYLRSLFDRNVTLSHAVLAKNIKKYLPIVYTPTVGQACEQFSEIVRKAAGITFYPGNIDRAEEILSRYKSSDIRVAVVTDNAGILGIGDQGAGGINICIGKLQLYTQGAGIAPWHCLPISLDVGTNSQTLLNNPTYLGYRKQRLSGKEYDQFIEKFAMAFKKVFPNALCQWEDFSKQNAFTIKDAYIKELVSFNDDIQGTGSITLAGVLAAMKLKKEKLKTQKFLIYGAGAGGVGITEQIFSALLEEGVSEKDAKKCIFTMDSRGLITSDHDLDPYKKKFAQDPSELPWFNTPKDNSLENIVKQGKITVLIGTSAQTNSFTKKIVMQMCENCNRPVILPISNPTDKAEAHPEDIYRWSDGKALVATGSPFNPVIHNGREIRIGQCNNFFVFPGIGLGVIASGAKEVLPSFFTAAAKAVVANIDEDDLADGIILPKIDQVGKISRDVAVEVGKAAIAANVCKKELPFSEFNHNNDESRLETIIDNMKWEPKYTNLIPV